MSSKTVDFQDALAKKLERSSPRWGLLRQGGFPPHSAPPQWSERRTGAAWEEAARLAAQPPPAQSNTAHSFASVVWRKSRAKAWCQAAGLRPCRPAGPPGLSPTAASQPPPQPLKLFQSESPAAWFFVVLGFFLSFKISSPLLSIQIYFCSLLLLYNRVFFIPGILLFFPCTLFLH